jgi:hypothetical protein
MPQQWCSKTLMGDSMTRTLFGLGSLVVLMIFSGCTMCCHPYDYNGPVYSHGGCSHCSSHSRVGSILEDGDDDGILQPEPQPAFNRQQPTPALQQPTPAVRPQSEKQAKRHVVSYKDSQVAGARKQQHKKQPQREEQVVAQRHGHSQVSSQVKTKQVHRQPKQVQRSEQEPELTQVQPGYVPGSERIISVTERVVGSETASSKTSPVASEPKSTQSPETLPSDGWTARQRDATER